MSKQKPAQNCGLHLLNSACAAHKTACILIFVACVLFFVLCWTIRYIRQKREEQIMAEFLHYYTKDLKPGESRTLEFL